MRRLTLLLPAFLLLAACAGAGSPAAPEPTPERYQDFTAENGTEVRYALVLPDDYEPGRAYPVLLALPPGPQTMEMVEAGLGRYWEEEARSRGWIVVSPATSGGRLLFHGPQPAIQELLDEVEERFNVENGRFHIAGISNGGHSAFRIALDDPSRVQSLLVVPGAPSAAEMDQLELLKDIPVAMYVGENDFELRETMQEAVDELQRVGAQATLSVAPGEGHVISSLNGGQELFDFLDAQR